MFYALTSLFPSIFRYKRKHTRAAKKDGDSNDPIFSQNLFHSVNWPTPWGFPALIMMALTGIYAPSLLLCLFISRKNCGKLAKKMAKIEFWMKWLQWPRFECEPETTWMRPVATRMIEWWLCDTAAATASWASVDLDGFLERTASGDWFRRDSSRAGDKRQPARCSRKTQDKFAIVSMAKKFVHGCMCIFCGEYTCISTGVVSIMHVQLCTLNGCCDISVHICVHVRYRVCICAHVCAVCSFSGGERGWGGSACLWGRLLLGVGGYFWQKER